MLEVSHSDKNNTNDNTKISRNYFPKSNYITPKGSMACKQGINEVVPKLTSVPVVESAHKYVSILKVHKKELGECQKRYT